jgi:hypothetical protein
MPALCAYALAISERGITGDGAAIFRHACWMDLEGIVSKPHRLALRQWPDARVAEDQEPELQMGLIIARECSYDRSPEI